MSGGWLQPQGNKVSQFMRLAFLRSPNYVAGSAGWTINQDGSAEFNNLTIRGTFNGTNFVINSGGAFFYSGTPATGNLIASITNSGGTDAFGNAYQQGITSYGAVPGVFTEINSGQVAQSSTASGTNIKHAGSMSLVDATTAAQAPAVVLASPNTSVTPSAGVSHLGVVGSSADGTTVDAVVVSPLLAATAPGGSPGQTPETWHQITTGFPTGWTGTISYTLEPDNTVMLDIELNIANGTAISHGATLANLPSAYRPVSDKWLLYTLNPAGTRIAEPVAVQSSTGNILYEGPTQTLTGAGSLNGQMSYSLAI